MLRFKLFLDLLWGRAERLIARAGFRVAAQEASIPCPLPAPPSALWWDLVGFLQDTYLPTFQYLRKNVRTYKNIKEKLVLLVFWPLPLSPPERGRGRKLGGVENGSLRTGSGGFPGELKRRGKSPKPKKATRTCTVHPKKVLQPNKERALCGSKHATWELSIERHDAVSSGNQKIPRRTVATVGMQTPCPVFAKTTLLRLRGNRGAHFDEGKPYLCFAPPTFNVV